jgi:ribosomal protein L21
LALNDDQTLVVGSPLVANAIVSGTVVETGKAKKVLIFEGTNGRSNTKSLRPSAAITAVKIDAIKGS